MDKVEIFGYRISAGGLEKDIEEALGWIENRNVGRYMATANPHPLVVASKDKIFQTAFRTRVWSKIVGIVILP